MSKRAPRTKAKIRQEQIAQAALELVTRHGLRRLNVAGLTRQVGVVPSALYRHYQSKKEVLEAVLDLISRRLLENVQAVRRESADPLACLHRLLSWHVQLIRDNVVIPRVTFWEGIFSGMLEAGGDGGGTRVRISDRSGQATKRRATDTYK